MRNIYCQRLLSSFTVLDILFGLVLNVVEAYCSIICSVLEYTCPVWHPDLSKKSSSSIEHAQKRVEKMVCPTLHYCSSLVKIKLERLSTRHGNLSQCF
jgi:hypothetical protein